VRIRFTLAALVAALIVAGCGGTTALRDVSTTSLLIPSGAPPVPASAFARDSASARQLGFPEVATNNTTRIPTDAPASIAAASALVAFPSTLPGTHPTVVAVAPTDDWEAALAASSLVSGPVGAPILLSDAGAVPVATREALKLLAPSGNGRLGGVQLLRIGDAAVPTGLSTARLNGSDPFAVAAAIFEYESSHRADPATSVIIASSQFPAFAMPAAGLAAENGDPILFADAAGLPIATQNALLGAHHPHIYVLGPPTILPDSVLKELALYGPVKRINGATPAALSAAFAAYRDPACPADSPCEWVPGSFGWAIRSPGHGFVLMGESDPLDAPAAAVLSGTGTYGPQLLLPNPNSLPQAVLNYFVNYTTPGIGKDGPTSAFYNHAWLIGTTSVISQPLQAQIDSLLAPVPVK